MNIKLSKKFIAFIVLLVIGEVLLQLWSESKGEKAIGIFNGLSFLGVSITAVIAFAISIWGVKKGLGKKNFTLYVLMMIISLAISIKIGYNIFGKDFISHNPFTTPKYIPSGYRVEYSNPQKGETYLIKGDKSKSIILTKIDKYAWTCNATTRIILNQEACWGLKEGVVSEQNSDDLKIIWDSNDKTYTILAHDKSLSEQDLTNIITNFP